MEIGMFFAVLDPKKCTNSEIFPRKCRNFLVVREPRQNLSSCPRVGKRWEPLPYMHIMQPLQPQNTITWYALIILAAVAFLLFYSSKQSK